MAAREMGNLSLSNALSLCILYRREHDPKFDRAAVRWVRRMQLEHSLRRQEVDLLPCSNGGSWLAVRCRCAQCAS
jgi:hypothetical protein